MPKTLNVGFPEKCIGCELCVLLAQRLAEGSVGISNSPIKITKKSEKYNVDVDTGRIEKAKEIVDICPTNVFTLEEK